MRKAKSIFLGVLFLLQIIFSQTAFTQVMTMQADVSFRSRVAEIKKRNREIPDAVLYQDIDFLKENIQKTTFAKKGLSKEMLINITADAWEDMRIKNFIAPTSPLSSISGIERYGILRIKSKPKQGAIVILNRKERWSTKTNTYKGVLCGTYLVEVELKGYSAEPKEITVPQGGDISLEFVLKKK
jgi:hypothetical protein